MFISTELSTLTNKNDQVIDTLRYIITSHVNDIPGFKYGIDYSSINLNSVDALSFLKIEIEKNISNYGLNGVTLRNITITSNNRIKYEFEINGKEVNLEEPLA